LNSSEPTISSYTFDSIRSSRIVASDATVFTSCVDNSHRLPVAVGLPGSSAFTRIDITQSRPITVDPTIQYVDYTTVPSQIAVSAASSAAPLQSPSIHWKKRLSYDYIPLDTITVAPIQAAPASQSVHIRSQSAFTYSNTHILTPNYRSLLKLLH